MAMYYIKNVKTLGETKCILYCNMYINFLRMGCIYYNQETINKLCPEIVNNLDVKNIHVPYDFKI